MLFSTNGASEFSERVRPETETGQPPQAPIFGLFAVNGPIAFSAERPQTAQMRSGQRSAFFESRFLIGARFRRNADAD